MVVDIGREMVELEEVVDDAARARERCNLLRHDAIGFRDWHLARLAHLVNNLARRCDDVLVILDERISTIEDGSDRLVVFAELVFILDIDNRDIQKRQARDVRFRQKSVLGKDDDHVVIDQGAGENHARLEVFHRYSTQSESLLADLFLFLFIRPSGAIPCYVLQR